MVFVVAPAAPVEELEPGCQAGFVVAYHQYSISKVTINLLFKPLSYTREHAKVKEICSRISLLLGGGLYSLLEVSYKTSESWYFVIIPTWI